MITDLIDRQEVIDLLKQMRKDGNMIPWEGKDVFAKIRGLRAVPGLKKAHWIGYPECLAYDRAIDETYYVCSECHAVFCCMDNSMEDWNCCPGCGALMEEGEQDG